MRLLRRLSLVGQSMRRIILLAQLVARLVAQLMVGDNDLTICAGLPVFVIGCNFMRDTRVIRSEEGSEE